ncbi:hypothetical protein [Fundidesulfovibrio terrae]|uniref:hypothetical protein n=1 Tax=Fundidesulfovibrio terrae TaxID=2922866 RepID=UPI001FAEB660|nr:hypothetical protein [Fundidesulfovibrio terrae]
MNHSSRWLAISNPIARRASGAVGLTRPAWPLRVLALMVLAAGLAGCGGTGGGAKYTLHLDAYAERVTYGKRFVVLQGVMEVKPGDTQFKAACEELAKAVEAKGYQRAASIEEADLGLYLAYHVTESSRAPFDNFHPRTPGLAPQQLFFSEYTRDVVVEAVDMARYKANDPQNVVWKIHVASKGPTSDMAKAMPYIAAAVARYMGTSGEVFVEVDSNFDIHPFKPAKQHYRP